LLHYQLIVKAYKKEVDVIFLSTQSSRKEVQEYSETKIDKDDINPPLLFVFGKDIEEKLIYIKLKVKNKSQKHVLCVSFHYAKEKMIFPYAQP